MDNLASDENKDGQEGSSDEEYEAGTAAVGPAGGGSGAYALPPTAVTLPQSDTKGLPNDTAAPSGDEGALTDTAAAITPVCEADSKSDAASTEPWPISEACPSSNACPAHKNLGSRSYEVGLLRDEDSTPPRTREQPLPEDVSAKCEREEGYRLIRNHLAMVLHAYECRRYNDLWLCNVPNCRETKLIVNHLIVCRNRLNCPERLCLSSRQIIAHWQNCNHTGCPICLPLPVPGSLRKLERNKGHA